MTERKATKPIRLFTRYGGPESKMLHTMAFQCAKESFLLLGEPVEMVFDHRTVTAIPLLNVAEGVYVLEEELEGSVCPV